ncbi:cyclase family protein [Lutimonas sp.]|uniref:cyclase family protein n=1 Tax=Lutimonas sp. TaxID=1872403 RepID=UPI003D9B6C9B
MTFKHQIIPAILLIIICSCESRTDQSKSSGKSQASLSDYSIIDLSHDYSKETIYWVTAQTFELDTVFAGQTDNGFYYTANNFSTAEHGGTHIDAPIHFAEGGLTVDQLKLSSLIGKGIKINVSEKALKDRDYLISKEDLMQWESVHQKQIPDGSIVLLETGYSKFYPDAVNYMGTDQRGPDAISLLHFPGLSKEAAQWLVDKRRIKAIGIDTPSIDYGQSTLFKSHVILMSHNIPAFENLTNLNQLPTEGFEILALPMKIKGGSGAPLRAIALIP